jgi:hypothetical protein
MYGSQFDGSAAFSGGGFMPSQATQAADSSFSSSKVILPLFFSLVLFFLSFDLFQLNICLVSEKTEENQNNEKIS